MNSDSSKEATFQKIGAPTCAEAVRKLQGARVLVVGDVMLDQYIFGRVERISPEAPVPVVLSEREANILGGAGNVAQNVKALGGDLELVAVCGADKDGDVLRSLLAESKIATKIFATPTRPTTKKTRIIAATQQVVRVDRESPADLENQIVEQVLEHLASRLKEHTVVILSDYGKGVINKKFMAGLSALLQKLDEPPMVLVDPKTMNYPIYTQVDLLTPNTKEAAEGANTVVKTMEDVIDTGVRLFARLNPKHLLITMGPDGMLLFENSQEAWHIPTFAKKVYDVTGAGDTVIASLALGIAAGLGLKLSCVLANHAAGVAVGQVGSVAVRHEDLAQAVQQPCPAMKRLL
ncbi:MAG: D-glycero-beta-D-manno-heptose-7-phosphate kinase [Desulfovibrionaceae bacterium]